MFSLIKDLKNWYFIFLETGLILALLVFLTAFSVELGEEQTFKPAKEDIDIIIFEDIPTTTQKKIPAIPPKPQVTSKKPVDPIIYDPIDDIQNVDMNLGEEMPVVHNRAEDDEDVIFVPFEKGAELIGGLESLYKEITYPQKAKIAGIEGTVIVQFIVDHKGNVMEAEVIRGIGGGCDEEALRAVEKMKFEPARQRERFVKIKMRIPISFQLKN